MPEIEFVHGDFFEVNLSSADLLYTCSTCFDQKMMEKITKLGENLKSGSKVITRTKPLESPDLEEIFSRVLPMSWGTPHVYIYRRQ